MRSEVRAGADAFLQLIHRVDMQTSSDFAANDDAGLGDVDVRDYLALVDILEASLQENFVEASPQRRQGYLRAFADLLAMHVDGAGPGDIWDPLASSEAAFAAPQAAHAAITRAAQ